jgi:hypothetical protein
LGDGQVVPRHGDLQIVFQGQCDGVIQCQPQFAVDNQILEPRRVVQLRGGKGGNGVGIKTTGKAVAIRVVEAGRFATHRRCSGFLACGGLGEKQNQERNRR